MNILVNGETRRVSADMTVSALLRELGLEGQRIAVAVNMEVVPRSGFDGCLLRDRDQVEIVAPVWGG